MGAADVAWPAYFGRRHLRSSRSVGFAVGTVGASLGPLPFGLAYDLIGGYDLPIAAMDVPSLARPLPCCLPNPKRSDGVDEVAEAARCARDGQRSRVGWRLGKAENRVPLSRM
jgi:hypothetical protein